MSQYPIDPDGMSAAEFAAAMQSMAFRKIDMALLTGVHPFTVTCWMTGVSRVPRYAADLARDLLALSDEDRAARLGPLLAYHYIHLERRRQRIDAEARALEARRTKIGKRRRAPRSQEPAGVPRRFSTVEPSEAPPEAGSAEPEPPAAPTSRPRRCRKPKPAASPAPAAA